MKNPNRLDNRLNRHATALGALALCGLLSWLAPLGDNSVQAATVSWNGTASGDWTTGADWVGGSVPGAGDLAYFYQAGGSPYTVTMTGGNQTIDELQVDLTANPLFDFGSSTLTTTSVIKISGGSAALVSGNMSGSYLQGYDTSGTGFGIRGAGLAANGIDLGSASGSNVSANTLTANQSTTVTSSTPTNIGMAHNGHTSSGNQFLISDAGTSVTLGAVRLGYAWGVGGGATANDNAIVVQDNATLTTADVTYIGRNTENSSNVVEGNTVTVRNGAEWNASAGGEIHVGFGDDETFTTKDNALVIESGGKVTNTGYTRVYGGDGNALRVSGGTYDGGLSTSTIWFSGTGGNASLYLGDGGEITVKSIAVYNADARFGDKSNASVAGFRSGVLNIGTMEYYTHALFSVGDGVGTADTTYHMANANQNHRFGGNITIETDGVLTGDGILLGSSGSDPTVLTIEGTLSPGDATTPSGRVYVVGDVIAGNNAVFNFGIQNLTTYDTLYATQSLTFNGTLNLTLLGGYMPSVNDAFTLFNAFTSHSGAFDTLNLASLDPGLSWDTSDLYSAGVLRVIPEPTSSILFLTGLAGLLSFSSRRRRV